MTQLKLDLPPEIVFDHTIDLGCYADGALGHDHIRSQLALLVQEVDGFDPDLAESLRGEMPDDAWDEDEALNLLNSHTAEGLVWTFEGGDLLLLTVEDEYQRDEDPDSPEEGDWLTNDHQSFTQGERTVLTLERDLTEAEMWANILQAMSAQNFFPNVWFVSDHGNYHLMRDPRKLDPITGVLK